MLSTLFHTFSNILLFALLFPWLLILVRGALGLYRSRKQPAVYAQVRGRNFKSNAWGRK